jgi:DNA-directed RNA polymerase subunit L
MIKDGSVLSLCGYKRTHPLEDRILFTLSMNNSEDLSEKEKTGKVVQVFKDCCGELIEIYRQIIETSMEV